MDLRFHPAPTNPGAQVREAHLGSLVPLRSLGCPDRLKTAMISICKGAVDRPIGVFHAPMMALTYDPRKLLKTGQGSRGSKLTLCGLICPKREVKCPGNPGAEHRAFLDAGSGTDFRVGTDAGRRSGSTVQLSHWCHILTTPGNKSGI